MDVAWATSHGTEQKMGASFDSAASEDLHL